MRLRLLVSALLLALLTGCSTIKVAYNQAEFIAAWMADDYFDLNGEQKDAFRAHFQRFHAWHRATQLLQYAALLEAAQKRLDTGVSAADATWLVGSVKTQYRTIVLRGYADAARLLSTLSDQQLVAARRQFEEVNRKYAREFGVGAAPDEQRRLLAKRQLERVEHWTGPLSAAQEARIAEMSRALPRVTDLRHQDRMRRQQEFLTLLAERKQLNTFAPKLREWLLDWDRTRTTDYDAALARFAEASAKMYVDAYTLLTAEQRHHIASRLQRYVAAFRELAQDTARTVAEEKRG